MAATLHIGILCLLSACWPAKSCPQYLRKFPVVYEQSHLDASCIIILESVGGNKNVQVVVEEAKNVELEIYKNWQGGFGLVYRKEKDIIRPPIIVPKFAVVLVTPINKAKQSFFRINVSETTDEATIFAEFDDDSVNLCSRKNRFDMGEIRMLLKDKSEKSCLIYFPVDDDSRYLWWRINGILNNGMKESVGFHIWELVEDDIRSATVTDNFGIVKSSTYFYIESYNGDLTSNIVLEYQLVLNGASPSAVYSCDNVVDSYPGVFDLNSNGYGQTNVCMLVFSVMGSQNLKLVVHTEENAIVEVFTWNVKKINLIGRFQNQSHERVVISQDVTFVIITGHARSFVRIGFRKINVPGTSPSKEVTVRPELAYDSTNLCSRTLKPSIREEIHLSWMGKSSQSCFILFLNEIPTTIQWNIMEAPRRQLSNDVTTGKNQVKVWTFGEKGLSRVSNATQESESEGLILMYAESYIKPFETDIKIRFKYDNNEPVTGNKCQSVIRAPSTVIDRSQVESSCMIIFRNMDPAKNTKYIVQAGEDVTVEMFMQQGGELKFISRFLPHQPLESIIVANDTVFLIIGHKLTRENFVRITQSLTSQETTISPDAQRDRICSQVMDSQKGDLRVTWPHKTATSCLAFLPINPPKTVQWSITDTSNAPTEYKKQVHVWEWLNDEIIPVRNATDSGGSVTNSTYIYLESYSNSFNVDVTKPTKIDNGTDQTTPSNKTSKGNSQLSHIPVAYVLNTYIIKWMLT